MLNNLDAVFKKIKQHNKKVHDSSFRIKAVDNNNGENNNWQQTRFETVLENNDKIIIHQRSFQVLVTDIY